MGRGRQRQPAGWNLCGLCIEKQVYSSPPPNPPSGTRMVDSLNPNPSALSLYFQPIFIQAKDVSEDPQRG